MCETAQSFIGRQGGIFAETYEPYINSGAFLDAGGMGRGGGGMPYENYSSGCHHEWFINLDPYDPVSRKAGGDVLSETFDPESKFKNFGVPAEGGALQIESIHHCHQKWGPSYDNYDIWLRKIRAMLDPNNVADSSGYIPANYSDSEEES
jgi:hypothetical protein